MKNPKATPPGWVVFRRMAVITLCGLFMLSPAANVCAADVVDRIVAVVNDEIIALSELNKTVAPYLERVKSMGYSLSKQRQMLFQARAQMLDQLINEKLTDQQVRRLRITVSEVEVDKAIEGLKERNYYTDEDLRDALLEQGLTMAAYRKQIRDQMLRSRLVSREVKSKILITDEDVAAYYKENRNEFGGEASYHLRHILKEIPSWTTDSGRDEIRASAEAILEELQNGASFAEMAELHSDSPTSDNGGDLGTFGPDSLPEQLITALEKISVGELTPVLDTDQGFQIFYLEAKKTAEGRTLAEASSDIQDKLYQDIIDKKFNDWIGQLREQAHIKVIK